MTTAETLPTTTDDELATLLESMAVQIADLHQMVTMLHDMFAPLLPIIAQMTAGMAEAPANGNPMLSLLSGMSL
jgi:hypothetical protein